MRNSKDNIFTGDTNQGNPYIGDFERGINYDSYEASFFLIDQVGNFPQLSQVYKTGSKRLVDRLNLKEGNVVLDIGSGTGISTLEIFQRQPNIQVIGVEISEGMFLTSLYKFNKSDGKSLLNKLNNERLLTYWQEFRKKTISHKNKVNFINKDFQEIELEPRTIDNAVANQVMHWMDLHKAFNQLDICLKQDGELIWSTSSHFYNDKGFPSLEYGFRYNDFVKYVLDEVNKDVKVVGNYLDMARPKHDIDSLNKIALEYGFIVEQIATYLIPVDLQIFIQNHIPAFVRELSDKEKSVDEINSIVKQAISRTIVNPNSLKDIKHKYDINPIFRTRRV